MTQRECFPRELDPMLYFPQYLSIFKWSRSKLLDIFTNTSPFRERLKCLIVPTCSVFLKVIKLASEVEFSGPKHLYKKRFIYVLTKAAENQHFSQLLRASHSISIDVPTPADLSEQMMFGSRVESRICGRIDPGNPFTFSKPKLKFSQWL